MSSIQPSGEPTLAGDRKIIWGTIAASVSALLISLPLPVGEFGHETWSGAMVLGMGFMGLLGGIIGWFANPLWLLSLGLLAFRKATASMIVGVGALLIALTSFQILGGVQMDSLVPCHGLGPAFFIWLVAMSGPLFGAVLFRRRMKARDLSAQ